MAIKEEKVDLLRRVDIYSHLREYELDVIAEYSEFVRYPKGEKIFIQGDPSDALYVVETGRVGIISIENEGDAVIAQIVKEESFGELDFWGKTGRSASAFAEEDTVLLRFPAVGTCAEEIFKQHAFISSRMLYKLLGTVSERIWNVNKMLHDKTEWLLDLHKQLLCDKMTGLYNQVYLKEDFINLLPTIGKSSALLMIKPDNFKDVNDRYGHVAGDQVLNLMAIFLQSELGENDIGIRYRGDEYAAVLPDADKLKALERAKAISQSYKEMDLSGVVGPTDIRLHVSIGIALYPEENDNSASLVSEAHRKMFLAREQGGNRVVI